MNFQKIYSNNIGRTSDNNNEEELPISASPAEDAARAQARISWRQSTITQEAFADLGEQSQQHIIKAIELACSYHVHNNHQQIIALLIRANELRNILNTYGRD